jgi:trimethylamine--corrinoid protein Co-methyltransferase
LTDLIEEMRLYERIHQNGKRVSTEIGVDITGIQPLMDILNDADAIDCDNRSTVFIPIKTDYIDRCNDQIPRKVNHLRPKPKAWGPRIQGFEGSSEKTIPAFA